MALLEDDQNLLDLQSELTRFTQGRSPEYLRQCLAVGCYVYGAGSYGWRILALLREAGYVCYGVIDRKFDNGVTEIDGVPAIHPAQLTPAQVQGRSLVIGVHNERVNIQEIIAAMIGFGFTDILWNADLPDVLGAKADNYWLTNRQFTIAHFMKFSTAYAKLADEASRRIFHDILRYRVTGATSSRIAADTGGQYYPTNVMKFNRPVNFIDGGAYTGDTYRHLSQHFDIGHWVAFEPDPENFFKLAKFARGLKIPAVLFPCGLSDQSLHMRFITDQGAASHMVAKDSVEAMTLACVALDDVLHGFKADYIKLDIEGAEIAALHGMIEMITASQPCLAVSAYHQPDHLALVVERLAVLAPYAKLHIRQHGENAFDTVVYAV
ncbi:MAG: FkbM family methyltransferase [Acidocella sp.]|nr:FkbM family methyltransferase [Acidocella sp.]